MHTFFKQIYRYTHPRSYRHNENIWPYCNINRTNGGEINFLKYKSQKVRLIPLSHLRSNFSGDVLIIATGSSIKKINFSKIPDMTIVGVNGAYLLKDHLFFRLYVIIDIDFIKHRLSIIKKIISDKNVILFTTVYGIIAIIKYFDLSLISCQLTIIEDACFRIYQPYMSIDQLIKHYGKENMFYRSNTHPNIAFSTNICNGIFDAGTVVFWTLQILFYLEFKRIYIAGLDMRNFYQPRFYETEQDKLPSFLLDKFSDILIPAFSLASYVFKKHGIEVKNLSLESGLSDKIFSKISIKDAFKK